MEGTADSIRSGAVAVLLGGLLLGGPTSDAGAAPASYSTLTPCRVFDSRLPGQGPALGSDVERIVPVVGACTVPPEATSVSFNVTVIQAAALGSLRMYAAGGLPGLPFISFPAALGQRRAGGDRRGHPPSASGPVGLTGRPIHR